MDMQRREFFRRLAGKTSETVIKHVESRVVEKARQWIRPPYALDELEFLLKCTRCGDCISACPPQIIFPLPARHGAEVLGTPALDLLNNGCHLCDGFPCVAACAATALQRPAIDPVPPPKLAVISIDETRCLPYQGPECGACAAACPVAGALLWSSEKPRINATTCVGCALCREACITEPKAILITSRYANDTVREI